MPKRFGWLTCRRHTRMRLEYAPHLSAEKLREGVVGGSLHVVSCCLPLRCTVLYCVVLCCIVLYCVLLHCVALGVSHSRVRPTRVTLLSQGRMHIDRLDPRNGSIIISSSNQTVKIMGRRCINRAIEGDTGELLPAPPPAAAACCLVHWP